MRLIVQLKSVAGAVISDTLSGARRREESERLAEKSKLYVLACAEQIKLHLPRGVKVHPLTTANALLVDCHDSQRFQILQNIQTACDHVEGIIEDFEVARIL